MDIYLHDSDHTRKGTWGLPTCKGYFSTYTIGAPKSSSVSVSKTVSTSYGVQGCHDVRESWLWVLICNKYYTLYLRILGMATNPCLSWPTLPHAAGCWEQPWYCAAGALLSGFQLWRWVSAKEAREGARWQDAHSHTLWADWTVLGSKLNTPTQRSNTHIQWVPRTFEVSLVTQSCSWGLDVTRTWQSWVWLGI